MSPTQKFVSGIIMMVLCVQLLTLGALLDSVELISVGSSLLTLAGYKTWGNGKDLK